MTSSITSGAYTNSTSSTSSVSGLVSGIDSKSIISQLMAIEAQPQTLLKGQLTDTKTDAAAYRQINTALATLSSAAQQLTGTGMTSARSASSSSSTVTASAGASAVPGSSLTFSVTQLASAQTSLSVGEWSSRTADFSTGSSAGSTAALPSFPLTVTSTDGTKVLGTIPAPAGHTLSDAVDAINKSDLGLKATVVQLGPDRFRLQVSSAKTGEANGFQLVSAGEDPATGGALFAASSTARDANLTFENGLVATSSSNTFSDLMTGVSVTVSAKSDALTTVSVANDTSAVTKKVQSLVDAANNALATIAKFTDSSDGSTAPLKGNYTLINLSNKILNQVSTAVGGSSAATAGIQLNRDGTIDFDSAKFSSALAANPALVQKILGGATSAGADKVLNTPDDVIDQDGLAARLSVLAEQASDSATGMITTLANSQDARAKDIQNQIDAWDLRLTQRQATLTNQFSAMETALGKLQSQSSWLTSQLANLPSWSSKS